jgi:hypothetical protein
MGKGAIFGLAAILLVSGIAGCSLNRRLVRVERQDVSSWTKLDAIYFPPIQEQAAIIFQSSGKGLRHDVEEAIKNYWRCCGVSDNPEEYCHGMSRLDTTYLRQCTDKALQTGVSVYADGTRMFFAPKPRSPRPVETPLE